MNRLINFYLYTICILALHTSSIAAELSWTKLDGPYGGGTIICLLKDDGTIWAGTDSYGIFKSSDLARTWQQVLVPELFGMYITCLDKKDNYLYIGTSGPLYRLDINTNALKEMGSVHNLKKIKITSAHDIYAIRSIWEDMESIYFVDHLTNLTQKIPLPAEFGTVRDIDLGTTDVLYALSSTKLVFSNDLGSTWHDMSPAAGFQHWGLSMALDVKDSGALYVISSGWPGSHDDMDPRMGYFYHYSPSIGWTAQENVPTNFHDITSLQIDGNIVTASPAGFSLDNGISWHLLPFNDPSPRPTTGSNTRTLLFIENSEFIASTAKELYFSTNLGQTWQPSTHGLNFSMRLDFHPNNDLFVTTHQADIYRKTPESVAWQKLMIAPNTMVTPYCVQSGPGVFLWAYLEGPDIVGSFDDGRTWNKLITDPSVWKFLRKNSKGYIYYAEYNGATFYRTQDEGLTTQTILPNLAASGARFFDLQIASDDALYLLIGIPNSISPSFYQPKLYVSYDDGDHWEIFPIPFANPHVSMHLGIYNASLQLNPAGHLLASLSCAWEPQDGAMSNYCQISSSKNRGMNWEIVYWTADTDIRTWAHSSGILYCYARENNDTWYASPEPDRRLWSSWDNWKTWQENSWDGGVKEFKEDSNSRLYIVTNYQGIYAADPKTLFIPKLVHSSSLTPKQTYGVCWIDYNNDGFDDLFFANQGPNELYRNKGDGSFTKITAGAIVTDSEPSRAATWGDYDNDGDADLFVANENANNSLYRNNGNGTFTKITAGVLVTSGGASRGCAWGDYDNDGWLDLVVVNRNEKNVLYHNLGDGTFQAVASPFGSEIGDSFGCSWCDYDLDGDLDLFIANRGENYLYRQTGKGIFQKLTAGQFPPDDLYSFGGSWGDYNNDGFPDLFVANADGPNDLYRNRGDGSFIKTTLPGITTDEGVSKGSGWADFDNDGDLDLFVANNGSKLFYLNNSDGTLTAVAADEFVYYPSNSLSLAWGDANNDGYQDLLVTSYDLQTVLYHNSVRAGHWFEVKCIGTLSNRSGIGARVSVKTNSGGKRSWQTREINSQSGFAAQSSLSAHFGLGSGDMIDSLHIVWPSGLVQVMTGVMADECLTITEATVVPVELASFTVEVKVNTVELQWRTLSEQNNYGFEIERRNDSDLWSRIGFVEGHNTTADAHDYKFIDNTLFGSGKYDYRLKILDQDGKYEYSETVQVTLGIPSGFELKQNYPNPFNPSTTIEFSLPRLADVRIRVISVLGEQVAQLVNGPMPAGRHKMEWNATDIGNGIYFILFEADTYQQRHKAVLMK